MLFTGKAFTLTNKDNVLELCFSTEDSSVNVFNQMALDELEAALTVAAQHTSTKALVLTSGKSVFIAGADINEFVGAFTAPKAELLDMLSRVNSLFNRLEDLPYPTIAVITGEAMGGGFEVCLACDFRIATAKAKVGLPEVKLGIMPGWGGSVRLPRLIGVDNALEWMCLGSAKRAEDALRENAIDSVVSNEHVPQAVASIVDQCARGKLDYLARRALKQQPLQLSAIEQTMAIESAKGVVAAKAGPHYPAPMTIIETVQAHAQLERDQALPQESESFVSLAKTDVAGALVGIFLKDQSIKRLARSYQNAATEVKQSAVLGAGIMGGGVAYQSASNGVPIIMKDIRSEALDDGLAEAGKLLQKQIERGKLKTDGLAATLNAINPVLSYGEFNDVDLVVEAVVENPNIKQSVLAEVESEVQPDTIITTNTSTISVNLLSQALKRPENFCGMHFFNPVHRMPLVEVIRADSSSERAIATTVTYALKMKKTPIVVNDCPGFLVNRILFAYFGGFNQLVADGCDVRAIDKALERFGWPMGPAYLLDVVGMDTAKHAADVMAAGFPERMATQSDTVIDALFKAERLGQKNGKGFYRYEMDKRGKPKKLPDSEGDAVVRSVQQAANDFSDEEIVDRLMIPMCIEAGLCLEDNIVSSPAEADMGLVYGIGFPPFRGGALHYVDTLGVANFCDKAKRYEPLGPLYQPGKMMLKMATESASYYSETAGVNA
ncbi:MAG: fatty acid oxidation complex subunit alpha FadB [Gammaproteobacteria bacterium]|nr:fatty acid oxidation complex subunit alpha FadB [Gammaproteobacteria bacterium]